MSLQIRMDSMGALINDMHMTTGLSVACGNAGASVCAHMGNRREVHMRQDVMLSDVRPVTENTLVDLASLTKLFTAVAVMQMVEKGWIKLTDMVGQIDMRFSRLSRVSLEDVLCFRCSLQTPSRIDSQLDPAQAQDLLFEVEPLNHTGVRMYSDIGAMVLKYVVERVSGLPFMRYIERNILGPAGMSHTYSRVPPSLWNDTMCYNYERRISHGRYAVRMDAHVGHVHDPKAAVLSPNGEDLCGHAGLFSTRGDLILFCQALLSGKLLQKETLLEMGTNRTCRKLEGEEAAGSLGGYTQSLGYLCFAKHPVQRYSEVPAFMSSHTLALSGFTGNHIAIDPVNGWFTILLGNRCHNRVTTVIPSPGKTRADYGVSSSGVGLVDWPDGKSYYSSVNYAYMKDQYLLEPLHEALLSL